MLSVLSHLADLWLSRLAKPDAAALHSVASMRPATVVTGASRGIGLALATRFARGGRTVVLIARHPGPLSEASAVVMSAVPGAQVLTLALDVTDAAAYAQVTATLDANGLYLDVLINNAGMGLSGYFQSHDAATIDRLIALNVGAVTRLTRLALPDMLARGHGGIINLASMGGFAPGPYQAAYYASRAYVVSLTQAVAAEAAGLGVRIAVVTPGPVETSFHDRMKAETALYRSLLPAMTPEAVANSVWRQFALGRRVIVPGILNTVAAELLRLLPHAISVPLMALLLKPRRGGTQDKT